MGKIRKEMMMDRAAFTRAGTVRSPNTGIKTTMALTLRKTRMNASICAGVGRGTFISRNSGY